MKGLVYPGGKVRVLWTASRAWGDNLLLRRQCDELVNRELVALMQEYEVRDIIAVHGYARGGDEVVEARAKAWGIATEPHPLTDEDWRVHGKGAGPRRNIEMLESGISLVIGLRLGGRASRGTTQCITEAYKRSIPVILYEWPLHPRATGPMEQV